MGFGLGARAAQPSVRRSPPGPEMEVVMIEQPMAVRKIETAERRVAEAPPGAFVIAVALIFAGVVGIAYWSERAYRRWLRANHPFAGLRARFEDMRMTYRQRRATLAEVTQVTSEILRW
jgi:hypothetical protein